MPLQFFYTFGVIVVFIIVVALIWYMLSYIIGAVQLAGRNVALSLGSVDATYVQIDSFYTTIFTAFLAIAILILAYWTWHYTQLKGKIMGE
jgi:hypothetical protein